ncbi:NUMOD1 domain-containing protein [Pedobacter nyackensis]|uniref:NUMOD1 domain-containing protein n=2 Tax=Pedobacter nyackensis TaxID=475255 RepID=A0A1W2B0X4_9SPHI|nr:NUMOD1 domain-containing protein [Pedobacter nyackensis]
MPNMNYPYENLSPDALPGERWAAIPKLDAPYEVSNLGRVRRLEKIFIDKKGISRHRPGMIIKTIISESKNLQTGDTAKYAGITLSADKKRHYLSVARLVYHCFVAEFDLSNKQLLVFPKDGDNLNLQAENLLLGTPKDKAARMIASGRRKSFFPEISEEARQRSREKIKATKKSNGTYNVSRYSLTGQLLETYPNARVAAEAMNTAQGYISIAARNSTKVVTACGYLWRRGSEPELDLKPMLKERWYGHSPLAKQQHIIGQYDLEGNLVNTYINTVEAAKAVKVHKNGIRNVINGRGLTYGGFIWSKSIKKKITVDPKITSSRSGISQYDLDGRYIKTFKNCVVAAKATLIDNTNIHLAVNGHTLTAGGYLWRKGQQLRININELRKHPHYVGSGLQKHMKRKREAALM